MAFLLAEAVSHMAAAALAPVDAITVTGKQTAPALQRGEPHAEQQGQLTGPRTLGDALIEDLQGLPAIVRRRQSSPSSPQKAWSYFETISSTAVSARNFSLRRSSCLSRLNSF